MRRWVGRGWLTLSEDGRVTEDSVELFVWEHMAEYRFAACEEWWLKQTLLSGRERAMLTRRGPRKLTGEELWRAA